MATLLEQLEEEVRTLVEDGDTYEEISDYLWLTYPGQAVSPRSIRRVCTERGLIDVETVCQMMTWMTL